MEVILHYMYVVAIKDQGRSAWQGDTPAELSLIGFWNLIVVWLKVRALTASRYVNDADDLEGSSYLFHGGSFGYGL
jgi:hypothetical protein